MATSSEISDRILQAILAKQLAPGCRLGEQQLATLFDCSRTIVREALMRLSARGVVNVSARRGWYLVEPSQDEAREAFEARLVIETGLLRKIRNIDDSALKRLRAHIARQRAALKRNDAGLRSFLLGDFHVCLAESLGNALLASAIRDLTVRTTLTAMRYQSEEDAAKSCAEHARIVEAIAVGDMAGAERLMAAHLSTWQTKLRIRTAADPLGQLRQALAPLDIPARTLHTRLNSEATNSRTPPQTMQEMGDDHQTSNFGQPRRSRPAGRRRQRASADRA